MNNYGDPNLTLAKTVAYELGFDYSISDELLFQIAAFYRDITNNQNSIRYTSVKNWSYSKTASTGYADVMGFEITIQKKPSRFWNAFANYTYQSSSSGFFGSTQKFEDPTRQKTWDENTINFYQSISVPSPYARANITFYTPDDFGPKWGSFYPLSGFMLNVFFNWRAGSWITYNPLGVDGITNNVQTTDYYDTQLRISKVFTLDNFRIELFADVYNVFNFKNMNLGGCFSNLDDRIAYYNSLHLPKSNAYNNIPGNDRIGDYRRNGADYQPMFPVSSLPAVGTAGVIYYVNTTGQYMEYANNSWVEVDKVKLDRILKDKAYIDMPNLTSFTFLNPRQIFFGLTLSLKIR